ncbi:hypothetical protein PV327_004252 [Microctonus hyperodae]|uniref:Uncharacterized protein n=1 Tax=Microctonus hyperodae TaxID=165561 RepID=A0AA39KMD6_MICHY|nr:hypothetical protein PV327_004252 [Microctonus hyperodae]
MKSELNRIPHFFQWGRHRTQFKYRWVEFTPALANDNRLVNTDGCKINRYVIAQCRADNGDKIPMDAEIFPMGTIRPSVGIKSLTICKFRPCCENSINFPGSVQCEIDIEISS